MGGLPVCDMRDLAVVQQMVLRTRNLQVADRFESCEGVVLRTREINNLEWLPGTGSNCRPSD